jgi:hypothetical protein
MRPWLTARSKKIATTHKTIVAAANLRVSRE